MSTLSLAELETYDPRAPQRPSASASGERRFLCPVCGDEKPKDAAHRSLTANTRSGAWNCKRCGARGKLSDFWQDKPRQNRAVRVRGSLRENAPQSEPQKAMVWRDQLKALAPLVETPGAEYLAARGIEVEAARGAGVRFSPDFYGRAAAVFPIRNRAGMLVAATGRYIDGRENPKSRTAGPKREGVFFAPVRVGSRTFAPLDKAAPAVVICEAPIDALSVAVAGFPALALCGASGPDWLHLACGFRRVMVAFDADEPGDEKAVELARLLTTYGAACERLRPEGGKDWNEVLTVFGREELSNFLALKLL
jgi:predicted RNA-binding Zn-ribbon protein involved in translation (DUF1610 family)